jgi:CheY-like chemotaxis protein
MSESRQSSEAVSPAVGVVEDDPTVAALAGELCRGLGADAALFASPAAFLRAFHSEAPRAVILDWRLEREVGAAAFMAIRHRFPVAPVVCWTASPPDDLPAMVHSDPMARFVSKAAGLAAFEAALTWALSAGETRTEPLTSAR